MNSRSEKPLNSDDVQDVVVFVTVDVDESSSTFEHWQHKSTHGVKIVSINEVSTQSFELAGWWRSAGGYQNLAFMNEKLRRRRTQFMLNYFRF